MITSPIEELKKDCLPVVSLRNIAKKFPLPKAKEQEALWALKGVSLDVFPVEVLGVIGRNGAGKTTLLNVIAGILPPTDGQITTRGKVVGLFNLGAGFQDELSGRENIFLNGTLLGASRLELNQKLKQIVEFSELGDFIALPLGSYSQGMRLRLGFSILVALDFEVLVLDEVLAVGDILFQDKCFQRLVEFKRQGKTLVISTQNMDLIERLCDRVLLLEHGRVLFLDSPAEAIKRYHHLLNTQRFFVGPQTAPEALVRNTKKWSTDPQSWGLRLGTKEVSIDAVYFINRFGRQSNRLKSREPLKVRVDFSVRQEVKQPHFGVAIFRNDGAYCFGPNTRFDGLYLSKLSPGKGRVELLIKELLLAPGEYRVSVAIWDKNEALAYDYQIAYYRLFILGDNPLSALLDIPFHVENGLRPLKNIALRFKLRKVVIDLASSMRISASDTLMPAHGPMVLSRKENCGEEVSANAISVRLYNQAEAEKNIFFTNEPAALKLELSDGLCLKRDDYLWLAIFGVKEVLCQGIIIGCSEFRRNYRVFFKELSLLPGEYSVKAGIWNAREKRLRYLQDKAVSFAVVSEKYDHGFVYLKHYWRIRER